METDILRIKGSFMRGVIRTVVSKLIRKKFGVDLSFDLKSLEITEDQSNPSFVSVNLSARVKKDDIVNLVKNSL